jgi:hypothetical protein
MGITLMLKSVKCLRKMNKLLMSRNQKFIFSSSKLPFMVATLIATALLHFMYIPLLIFLESFISRLSELKHGLSLKLKMHSRI